MVKPLAGSIINTVHRTLVARVILTGVTMNAWASKRLVVDCGILNGVLVSVSRTARRVRVVLVEDWYPDLGFLRIQVQMHAAKRTCPSLTLQTANIINKRLFKNQLK